MAAIVFTLLFLSGGLLMVRLLLPRKNPIIRIWLGVSLGFLMLMTLPALCAYAFFEIFPLSVVVAHRLYFGGFECSRPRSEVCLDVNDLHFGEIRTLRVTVLSVGFELRRHLTKQTKTFAAAQTVAKSHRHRHFQTGTAHRV